MCANNAIVAMDRSLCKLAKSRGSFRNDAAFQYRFYPVPGNVGKRRTIQAFAWEVASLARLMRQLDEQLPHRWTKYLPGSNSTCNTPIDRPHLGQVTKGGGEWGCQRRDSACVAVDRLIPHRIMGLAMMGMLHVDLETAPHKIIYTHR